MNCFHWVIDGEDSGNIFIIAKSQEDARKVFTRYAYTDSGMDTMCSKIIAERDAIQFYNFAMVTLLWLLMDKRHSVYRYAPNHWQLIIDQDFKPKQKSAAQLLFEEG